MEDIEYGEYSTADGRIFRIYTSERTGGGQMPGGSIVQPATLWNLDVDGRGALWGWTHWGPFADLVNEIAGETVLDPSEPDDEELVPIEDACPRCGERHMDKLIWSADGVALTCQQCGQRYIP